MANWRENQIIKDFIMSHEPFGGTPFLDRLRLYRNTMNSRPRPYNEPRQPNTNNEPRQSARTARPQAQDPRYVRDPPVANIDRQWEELNPYVTDGRQDTVNQSTEYKISVDVDHFTSDDLVVKVIGRIVIVKGQHEQRQEGLCTASRLFVKKYKMPDHVDLDFLRCDLTRDRYLVISAPVRELPGDSYRSVPVRKIEASLHAGSDQQPRQAGTVLYSGRSQVYLDLENLARGTEPRVAPPPGYVPQQFAGTQQRTFAQPSVSNPRAKKSADGRTAPLSDEFLQRAFAQTIADFQPRNYSANADFQRQPTDAQTRAGTQMNEEVQPRTATQNSNNQRVDTQLNTDIESGVATQPTATQRVAAGPIADELNAPQPNVSDQHLAETANAEDHVPDDNAIPEQI